MITNAEAIQSLQTAAEQWAETLNWPIALKVEIGKAEALFTYHPEREIEKWTGTLTITIPVTGIEK